MKVIFLLILALKQFLATGNAQSDKGTGTVRYPGTRAPLTRVKCKIDAVGTYVNHPEQGVAKYVSKIAVEMVLRDISLKTALKHGLHIGCLVNCSKVDKTCENEFVRFVELSSAKPVVYGPSTMQLTLDTSKGNKVHCEGLPEYFDIGSETRIPSSNEKPAIITCLLVRKEEDTWKLYFRNRIHYHVIPIAVVGIFFVTFIWIATSEHKTSHDV